VPKKSADTSTTDPVAIARAEVEKLNGLEYGHALLYRQRAKEVAGERAGRADAILDAKDPVAAARESARQVSSFTEELAGLAEAADRARERRHAAIPAVFLAEAEAKEREADALEADATRLQTESAELRAELERHDEWGYLPAQGQVEGTYYSTVPHGNGEFRAIDARGPLFARKLAAAHSLRREAAAHRLKTPEKAGMIAADSVDDLFTAVHADAMRIGPSVAEIVSWSEQAVEKERRRRERSHSGADGFVPAEAPMKLHMEFRDGVINQASSGIVREESIQQADPYHTDGAVQVVPEDVGEPESATSVARRSSSERSPFATGPTPEEIEREAAATGEPIEDVARRLGATLDAAAELVEVGVDEEIR
jgi:hypothetical protein